jgi:carboxypeptidase C (cathepsin A)
MRTSIFASGRQRYRVVLGLAVAAHITTLAAGRPAAAQAPGAPQYAPVVTKHEGIFNGKKVAYTATVSETLVPNGAGKIAARIVSTAYTADRVDRATRPVLFVCNGGPIGPSHPLHILALGPRRLAIPPDLGAPPSAFTVVDNVYTVLDVADLVFFDPASTGWSRVLEGVKPEEYYTTDADAQQMAAFVDRWLRENDRLASPKYLLGESYATIRVPETAKQLARLPQPIVIDGMFLMGQAANQLEINTRPYNILAPVIGLPSVAATAWYHDKIDRKGRTVYQVIDEAMKFGANEYLEVLFKGNAALDEATRARIANRLEAFTGIPASYFLANNLRITRPTFQTELFRKEGMKLGSDDARYVGPARGPEPDAAPSAEAYTAVLRYFRDELKVQRSDEYRRRQFPPSTESRRGGGGWAYASTASPFSDFAYTSSITEVMNKNPNFRVVVGSGIYDMKTTTGAAEYLVAQSGWPKARVRISHYEGGHMAYTNESALKKFTDDVRMLVQGK